MNRPMASHRPKPKRAGARPKPKPKIAGPVEPPDNRFRVLIAVHRPRYRSRAERAVDIPGWAVRSLLTKEDPIGLMNQKPPHILIVSGDFGRSKTMAYVRAAQKYRSAETKVVGVFESEEEAAEAAALCDVVFFPPWKTIEMRAKAAELYEQITGAPPVLPDPAAYDPVHEDGD